MKGRDKERERRKQKERRLKEGTKENTDKQSDLKPTTSCTGSLVTAVTVLRPSHELINISLAAALNVSRPGVITNRSADQLQYAVKFLALQIQCVIASLIVTTEPRL
jgi:hypothetical protein